jgi:2'-5' RNA ligase
MPANRLFVAIDLPDGVQSTLAALRTGIPGASWTKPAQMHLTLKFLGDGIEEARVPEISAALRAIHAPALTLAVRGVGRFPPGTRQPPRVLWAGLDAPPALAQLAGDIERALAPLGFPPEGRPFAAHLTLARLKSRDGEAEAARFLARHADLHSDPFTARAFHLYASQLSPQGATYTVRDTFPLGAAYSSDPS